MYNDHLSEAPYKNKCSVPPWKTFKSAWLKFYLYLTKAWYQSLLLVKELLLHWSPVCQ